VRKVRRPEAIAFSLREGGDWIAIDRVQLGDPVFAIAFADGTAWDIVVGWRRLSSSPLVLRERSDNPAQPRVSAA
jgi:hypothetical protein